MIAESPFQARPLPCERCGGASGHQPIPARSSVPSETTVRGLIESPRSVRVCYPCVIRLTRESKNVEAVERASIARRLLEVSRPTASFIRHMEDHSLYHSDCHFCRVMEAERPFMDDYWNRTMEGNG